MDTYKPVSHVRIQAFQFKELNPVISQKYPIRYIIEDDALGKGHYELWIESESKWKTIMPGDYIVVRIDEPGYDTTPKVEFEESYEPA